jgi:hypothetical protein
MIKQKNDLKNMINPNDTPINGLINARDGSVILKCKKKEDINNRHASRIKTNISRLKKCDKMRYFHRKKFVPVRFVRQGRPPSKSELTRSKKLEQIFFMIFLPGHVQTNF